MDFILDNPGASLLLLALVIFAGIYGLLDALGAEPHGWALALLLGIGVGAWRLAR